MITTDMAGAGMTDEELVASSIRGDRDAFTQIVARYQSLVCSLAYSATGSLSQSEDMAQETFLTAWKQMRDLREPAKLRGWLCGIARNLISSFLRREGCEPVHAAETLEQVADAPAKESLPPDQAISREEEAILWRAIERIPELYREPLVLFYREHQSVQSVAEGLQLSEDAVKQRLSRGRKLLQDEVLAFVQGTLERSNPGKAFTIGIIALLPSLTLSAKAATLGATAIKGGATAKAAVATGMLGAIFSPMLIFFGNYVGYRMALDDARSETERGIIQTSYRRIVWLAAIIFIVFAGIIFWICNTHQSKSLILTTLLIGLVVIYVLMVNLFTILSLRKRRNYLVATMALEKPTAADGPAYEYRSRKKFMGMPLVHIRIGDRLAILREPVKAWIAVGDYAVGGLFAFGGMAVAPISIGGLAIGGFSFGGAAVGVIVLSGMGVGMWAFGGVALGWQAFGGCAIAWDAAIGGLSVAKNFALGGMAHAVQANNEAAQGYMNISPFFQIMEVVVRYTFWLNLLWIVPLFWQWRAIVRRRREQRAN